MGDMVEAAVAQLQDQYEGDLRDRERTVAELRNEIRIVRQREAEAVARANVAATRAAHTTSRGGAGSDSGDGDEHDHDPHLEQVSRLTAEVAALRTMCQDLTRDQAAGRVAQNQLAAVSAAADRQAQTIATLTRQRRGLEAALADAEKARLHATDAAAARSAEADASAAAMATALRAQGEAEARALAAEAALAEARARGGASPSRRALSYN